MIVIACVDDHMGMMFNHRRQSKDLEVRKQIAEEVGEGVLWMNAYSAEEFAENSKIRLSVSEDFLKKAGTQDFCFVENVSISAYEGRIEKVILYLWNRVYPSDFIFDLNLKGSGWRQILQEDFAGKSHKRITKEVYVPALDSGKKGILR